MLLIPERMVNGAKTMTAAPGTLAAPVSKRLRFQTRALINSPGP